MPKESSNTPTSKQNKLALTAIAIATVGLIALVPLVVVLVSPDSGRQVAHIEAKPVSLEQVEEDYRSGRHEQAIDALENWLARAGDADRRIPLAKDLLVSSYWKTGGHQKAFDLLQEIVKANPQDTDSVYRLGLLATEMGQEETAIEYFAQATTGRAGQPQYHTGYAQTLAELGRYEEAREQWEIVRTLTQADSPHQAVLRGKIGDTYLAENQTWAAGNEFRAGLKIDPDNEYLKSQLDLVGG